MPLHSSPQATAAPRRTRRARLHRTIATQRSGFSTRCHTIGYSPVSRVSTRLQAQIVPSV